MPDTVEVALFATILSEFLDSLTTISLEFHFSFFLLFLFDLKPVDIYAVILVFQCCMLS